MDISSIWGQVLLNACGVRLQQNLPNIIISQDPVTLLPLTYNTFVYQNNNPSSEESDSDNEIEEEIVEEIVTDNNNKETVDVQVGTDGEEKTEGDKKPKGKKINRTRFSREEYECPQCPYKCTTENAYVKHLRFCQCSEEKPLSCPVCGKDRKCEQSLQLHLMKHKQGKQFCCDLCKFKSVQLKKIIQHRRMHTGEKPHLCPHCTYRSSRRDNLRSHVRRVHKEEDLKADTFSPTSMIKSPRPRPQ